VYYIIKRAFYMGNIYSVRAAVVSLILALLFALAISLPMLGRAEDEGQQNTSDQNSQNIEQSSSSSAVEDLIEGKGEFKLDHFPKGLDKKFEVRKPSMTINPQGKVLIVASEVTESNWPNLKVKVWGNTFSVHVMPDARLIGLTATAVSNATSSATTTIQVAVGDRVDVLGYVEEATGLIHATAFKNRSQVSKDVETIRARIQELMNLLENLRAQLKLKLKAGGGGF
jgi:hypothetical protein